MIRIAIDGPSGSGKSTLAKAISKDLGIVYVDTGALSRTVGYYVYTKDVQPTDAPAVSFLLAEGEEPKVVYAYCNLHGLWKKEL